MIAYIGLAIGILIGGFGIISGIREKNDTEQRKIYYIAGIIGVVIAVIAAVIAFR